ncbi:hypothetical protein MHJ97_11220 [Macrococcus epidermidis]|uniref:hypothetical protein n=1 Tax=Macrococcus epidermidis TaxID=1902580 RepID=UPI001EF33160|nr:hypothetical protein [Macrococcus epidermidis]MCG7420994.1 hypothetical protein [Macrococcus epidermidis]
MWYNEDKFPNNYSCPPADAYNHNGILYKVSASDEEDDEYLRKTAIEQRNNISNNKLCQACGHSVFLDKEDIIKSKETSSKVSKGVLKKWKHIYSFKPNLNSKILDTPSKNTKNHHTYWHYGNNNIIFCYEQRL